MTTQIDALKTADVVKNAEVDNLSKCYLLGLSSVRQTVYSQQWRAIRLVYSLFETRRISAGGTVVVIGGGIAGMTAAVAAAYCGAGRVRLLERQPHLLHLQRGNQTRWLHPRIYDWPQANSLDPDTRLPFLNWSAGTAGNVAKKILYEWHKLIRHKFLPIDEICNASDARIICGPVVTWNDLNGHHTQAAAAVIVATGFGLENLIGNGDGKGVDGTPSYWHNDDFDQPSLMPIAGKRRILVSGTGDGALIDLLRLCIRDFVHADVVRDFFPVHEKHTAHLIRELSCCQNKIASGEVRNAVALLQVFENKFDSPNEPVEEVRQALSHVDARLRERMRDDTQVVLNGTEDSPLSHRSSLLHTFLTWRLLVNGVQYIQGKLKSVKTEDSLYIATFERACGGEFNQRFHRVIARHGANDKNLKHLSVQVEANLGSLKEIGYQESEDLRQKMIACDSPVVEPSEAARYLNAMGFVPGSTELRNRKLEACRMTAKDRDEYFEDDHVPRKSDDLGGLWRAKAMFRALCDLDKSGRKVCIMLGGFGTGKSILLYRLCASLPSVNDADDRPLIFLVDYSSINIDRSFLDQIEGLKKWLESRRSSWKRDAILIMDNFSEGVRTEFRLRGDGESPLGLIKKHLEELKGLLRNQGNNGYKTAGMKFVFVLDAQDDDSAPALEAVREMVDISIREKLEAEPCPVIRLCAHSAVVKTFRFPYSDSHHHLVGDMLRLDSLRIEGLLTGKTVSSRCFPKPTEEASVSLMNLYRPTADYLIHKVAGTRTHPLVVATSRLSACLQIIELHAQRLEKLGEAYEALKTALSADLKDRSQDDKIRLGMNKFKAAHDAAWDSVFERSSHLMAWLATEWSYAELLVAQEVIRAGCASAPPDSRRNKDGNNLALFLLAIIDFEEQLGMPVRLVGTARSEVPSIVYSNLISVFSNGHTGQDGGGFFGEMLLRCISLVRPLIEVIPCWLRFDHCFLAAQSHHAKPFKASHDVAPIDMDGLSKRPDGGVELIRYLVKEKSALGETELVESI